MVKGQRSLGSTTGPFQIFRGSGQPSKVEGLTPFFTEDGATPWGEVVPEAKVQRAKMHMGRKTKRVDKRRCGGQ
jgi:hypothetical protein